jgi:hypothetical protein
MSKPIPERTYIDIGLQYGLIKPDWLLEQYLVEASTHEDGYETVAVQGVQGSGKSSRAMQMVSWIKENELREKLVRDPSEKELWESVLGCIIFKSSDFVRTLEAVPDGEPLSVLRTRVERGHEYGGC